jgi:hypothetical protein
MEFVKNKKGFINKGITQYGTNSNIGSLSLATDTPLPIMVTNFFNDSFNIQNLSTTQMKLLKDKKYKITAEISAISGTSNATLIYGIYNVTTGAYIGALGVSDAVTDTAYACYGGFATAIIAPSVDTTIEVRHSAGGTLSTLISGCKITIEEMESYVIQSPALARLGVGGTDQSWQNKFSSRNRDVTYTNTTGKPIMISVGWAQASTGTLSLYVNGVNIAGSYVYNYASGGQMTAIIPNNNTYLVSGANAIAYFFELR